MLFVGVKLAAMEPIRHTLTARLKNLKMYREDLDQLVAMFRRHCKTVTISDSKYRYDSFDEMNEKAGSKVKDLDILGENPGIRFLLNKTEISRIGNPPLQGIYNELRTEEITDAADSLFYKTKDFLATYERPGYLKGWVIPTIVGLVGVFWFALHNSYVNKDGQTMLGSLPGVVASGLVFVVSFAAGLGPRNYVSLETKRNSASFFRKNWEEFAKHWIIALGTGIIGWLIGHYGK
jgi:hypothetical protein